MRKRQFHDAVNLSAVPSHCVQGDTASIVWPVVSGRGGICCPALSFRREAVGLEPGISIRNLGMAHHVESSRCAIGTETIACGL
jgi:hypothetical protein